MDTSQKTESIRELIRQVSERNIVLPEFQRDFVWELSQTFDLFDSIIRDIFIGSLIYGIPSFDLTVREIDLRTRKAGGGRREKLQLFAFTKKQINERVKVGGFRLLLDGQQRVTSLYRALKGTDPVWIVIKNDDELSNEAKNKTFADRSLEELLYGVEGTESADHLSVSIADVYQMLEGKVHRESQKAEILSKSVFCKAQEMPNVIGSDVFARYLHVSDKLQDLLKAEKLLSYYLLDTDEEKFALFFERSNSKGIQLNFIDILAAKLYSGFNLRKHVEDFEDENPEYTLNRETLVRAISLAVSDNTDVGRAYILTNLVARHFDQNWERFCTLYKRCLEYLFENSFLLSQDWIPYENMLIPMMMFLREMPHDDASQMTQRQSRFIRAWYWGSIFSERYSLHANTIIVEDARMLTSVAKGQTDMLRQYLLKIRPQIKEPADLKEVYRKGSATYRGVLNLVNYQSKGLLDWRSTHKLSFNSRLEDHHIFPREFLRRQNPDLDEKATDCVLNRTLIPKITNIKIGAKAPSVYLKQLRDESNPDLSKSLVSHVIPPDLLDGGYDELYTLFLDDRADVISDLIKAEDDHLVNLEQEFLGINA